VKASTGSGKEDLLFADDQEKSPQSWSPDGRYLLYIAINPKTYQHLWVLPLFGDQKPFPFLQTPSNEGFGAQFSPDGHWIAYGSNESGQTAVYVAPFPGPGERKRVSTEGGGVTRWRGDGKELYYLTSNNELMAASVRTDGTRFEVDHVRPLFHVEIPTGVPRRYLYDVTPDGERFLVVTAAERGEPLITLDLNWTTALKKTTEQKD